MTSYLWRLIDSRSNRGKRILTYLLIVFGGILFALPRIGLRITFFYVVLVYPTVMVVSLFLAQRILPYLERIQESCAVLLEEQEERQALVGWWENLTEREHILWSTVVALLLAAISLMVNANTSWSRFTDAAGVFYIGFAVGEVAHLLLLVPLGISRLRGYQPRLNPLNPAGTVSLQVLAETISSLALLIGFTLLLLNALIATVAVLFPHLTIGVLMVSMLAWAAMICIAIYPHLVLWELARTVKHDTMAQLDQQIMERYGQIEAGKTGLDTLAEVSSLYSMVQSTRTSPVSLTGIFGLLATLLLNILPVLVSYF